MELLFILLALLVLTRTFGELAERLSLPSLVGELIIGVLLGGALTYTSFIPAVQHFTELTDGPVFNAVAELGMFFLMLLAGIEMEPRRLAKASGNALLIALGGALLPLALGFLLGLAVLPPSDYRIAQALFLGTAMSITAVPVTVRVLMDLGWLDTRAGHALVSAALFDDILSLLLLSLVIGVISTGAFPSMWGLLWLMAKVAVFFGLTIVIGWLVFPWVGSRLRQLKVPEAHFSALLIAALAYAVLAEVLALHFIIGAFTAGVFFRRRTAGEMVYRGVQLQVSAITTGFLAPIFFASIGLRLRLDGVLESPGFVLALLGVAFVSKMVGAGGAAWLAGLNPKECGLIGIAMSGRGAVELIIADLALRSGLLNHPEPTPPLVRSIFSAIVIMAVVTTLATPVLLRGYLAWVRPLPDADGNPTRTPPVQAAD